MKKVPFQITCIVLHALCTAAFAGTNTIYFLVEGYDLVLPGLNSFALPLCQPDDIAHARDLIVNGPFPNGIPNEPVPIVKIAAGADGINRDYYSAGKREWSWHVGEFAAFTDDIVPETSGSPLRIERDVQAWLTYIEQNGGYTSFPFYTVVLELGVNPYWLTVTPATNSLVFNWADLGTNYVYTLESKASFSKSNWTPVAGIPWPVHTNQWTFPMPLATSQFYRVRAEASGP